jgi:hypothetical protein
VAALVDKNYPSLQAVADAPLTKLEVDLGNKAGAVIIKQRAQKACAQHQVFERRTAHVG